MQIEEAKKELNNLIFTLEIKHLGGAEAIATVFNELEKKDRQIEASNQEHKYDVEMIDEVKGEAVKLYKEIREKDKVIDLMAEQLAGLAIFDIAKEEPLILGDKEEVKQYFYKKASDEKC